MVCVGDGCRLFEGESCLPGTEDYVTTPCGMLEAVGALEGQALNQFREQSQLSEFPHTLFVNPKIFIPFPFHFWHSLLSKLNPSESI